MRPPSPEAVVGDPAGSSEPDGPLEARRRAAKRTSVADRRSRIRVRRVLSPGGRGGRGAPRRRTLLPRRASAPPPRSSPRGQLRPSSGCPAPASSAGRGCALTGPCRAILPARARYVASGLPSPRPTAGCRIFQSGVSAIIYGCIVWPSSTNNTVHPLDCGEFGSLRIARSKSP